MQVPTVSFVVPCYKLGHLLSECIRSILSQTYPHFEVLIMDDCSPDNTEEIAKSIRDPRVKYIRNEQNLGLLDNFNKGIGLSRGKYVWIISADDYLRRTYILGRYVKLMELNPNVGYTLCPGVTVKNGQETGVEGCYGRRNRIVKGHVFLKTLLEWNRVMAPSAMARRECYERIDVFPRNVMWAGVRVDMSWVADWYSWCLFSLSFDVGYFAEPMVCYRIHDLAITNSLTQQENVGRCAAADIAVPWLVRQKALELGERKVARDCLRAIAHQYAAHRASKQYRSGTSSMTTDQLEESLCRSTDNEGERDWIRARVSEAMGDKSFWHGDLVAARKLYLLALQRDWRMMKVRFKLILLLLGTPGKHIRTLLLSSRSVT
jgi:glycosyltransferase involved in cell wall biosynthesis